MNWNDPELLTVLVAFTAVVATLVSVIVNATLTVRNAKLTQQSELWKWLREKQREAYLDFLTATRSAYQSIDNRDKDRAQLLAKFDGRDPAESDKKRKAFESEREAEINGAFVRVKHAQAVLDIVGPRKVADLGRNVHARLRLDRWLTSATLESQLAEEKDEILRRAEETGDARLLTALRKVLVSGDANGASYEAVLRKHRLDDFWDLFITEAGEVLVAPVGSEKKLRRSR